MHPKNTTSDLIFVTGNAGKVVDVSRVLSIPLHQVDLDIDEIQSLDLEKIARHKAIAAFAQLQERLIVDDTGVYIKAWHGFPGPFIKHIQTAGGAQLLLDMMRGQTERRAYFHCVAAYHDGKDIHIHTGRLDGTITTSLQGEGWGFTAIFIPDGYTKTMAQLRSEGIPFNSHRHQAFTGLRERIEHSD